MNLKLYDYILQTLRDIYTEMDLVKNEDNYVKRVDIVDNYLKESVDLLAEEINLLIQQQTSDEKVNSIEKGRLEGEIESLKKRWFIF